MNYCKQIRLIVAHEQVKEKVWIEYESKSRVNIFPCDSIQSGLEWLGRLEHGVDEWVTDEPKDKKKIVVANDPLGHERQKWVPTDIIEKAKRQLASSQPDEEG